MKSPDALSKTTLKRIKGGKYAPKSEDIKFIKNARYNMQGEIIKLPPPPEKGYEKRSDGWRKKR